MATCFLTSAFNDGLTEPFAGQLARYWNGGNNFLYIASSFHDPERNERYCDHFCAIFSGIGADFEPEILDERVSPEDAPAMIAEADVIFLAGGNVTMQMASFEEYHLREAFANLKEDAVVIGMSAGSINMAERVVIARDPEDDLPELAVYEGLGLVDLNIEPHFDPEREDHLPDIEEAAAVNPIFALYDGSFIVCDGYEKEIFGRFIYFH